MTSPGGTTAEALKVLMAADGIQPVFDKALGGGVAAIEGTRRVKSIDDTALDAFLGLVAEKGYAAVALRDVAEAAGVGMADLYRVYPDKVALVAAFMARIDGEVLAGTPGRVDPEETARDRLFDVLMRRYDALTSPSRRAGSNPPRRHA